MRDRAPRFKVEYAIEAALLGLFMISACGFVVLLEHPGSMVHRMLPDPGMRRVLMGLAMGSTAVALIYSPLGKRSGAHMNPAVTLTFARLGKVAPRDAALYTAAQFAGGLAGVLAASLAFGDLLADRATNYAATLPGPRGVGVAFGAEALITFVLMWVILVVSNHPRRAHLTGLCAGLLVALYIAVEAPLSGMSMNPARTLGSAVFAGDWTGLWIYFVAPPLGMLAAAELYLRRRGGDAVFCAKLCHAEGVRCVFCEWREAKGRKGGRAEGSVSTRALSSRGSERDRGIFSPGLENRGERSLAPLGMTGLAAARPSALPPPWNQSPPAGITPPSSPACHTTKEKESMRRRTWIAGLVVLGAIGWYLFRPELLFVKTTVNESLPVEVAARTDVAAGQPAPSSEGAKSGVLLSGQFRSYAHETVGTAAVHELGDRRVLRLTGFSTSNGPDVRVYLVAANDATDDETVTKAGFVELGKLKGTQGDQNYEIPAGLDLEKYRAVTIWCRRFSANFGTAPLTPAS